MKLVLADEILLKPIAIEIKRYKSERDYKVVDVEMPTPSINKYIAFNRRIRSYYFSVCCVKKELSLVD